MRPGPLIGVFSKTRFHDGNEWSGPIMLRREFSEAADHPMMLRGAHMPKRGRSMHRVAGRRRGFSFVELVIVVVIVAIIGAIAAPKLSRGAGGARDASVIQSLS